MELTIFLSPFIDSNDLKGSIPSTIGILTGLDVLNAHSNHLTGTIPSTLIQMSALRYLELGELLMMMKK